MLSQKQGETVACLIWLNLCLVLLYINSAQTPPQNSDYCGFSSCDSVKMAAVYGFHVLRKFSGDWLSFTFVKENH